MTSQYCPVCGDEAFPTISPSCSYLIIEELPELVIPTPSMQSVSKWKRDEWTPKKILSNELSKVDMVIQQFQIISVYPHYPPDSGIPNQTCYDFGLEEAVKAIYGKMGVIVLGSNLCKEFAGYELKKVQGLSGVDSQYIPDGDVPRVFLPTIRSIYSVGSGEFRLGLKRFASQLGAQ